MFFLVFCVRYIFFLLHHLHFRIRSQKTCLTHSINPSYFTNHCLFNTDRDFLVARRLHFVGNRLWTTTCWWIGTILPNLEWLADSRDKILPPELWSDLCTKSACIEVNDEREKKREQKGITVLSSPHTLALLDSCLKSSMSVVIQVSFVSGVQPKYPTRSSGSF